MVSVPVCKPAAAEVLLKRVARKAERASPRKSGCEHQRIFSETAEANAGFRISAGI